MDWIKQIVERLVLKYKTNDPFEIADYRNILVSREPLGDTLGYHNTYSRVPFIHINRELNSIWQRFVCAHELGHNILHPKINTPFLLANTLFSVDRIEREANEFAIELLMPDQVVQEYRNTTMSIHEIASAQGIPQELAQLKTKLFSPD